MSALETAPHIHKHVTLYRILQFLFWILGTSCFVWAFLDPRFRDSEGFLEGTICLPVAVGVALIALGWAIVRRLRHFAFWFVLALVGQAVTLQLIEAGPAIRYQHYKPLNRLMTETQPLILIFLAGQTALVVAGLKTRWPKIRVWLGRTFKPWQLLGVSLVFFLTSAAVSREISTYGAELIFATFVQAVALGNIVLMAWALPSKTLASGKQRLDKLLGRSGQERTKKSGSIDRFVVLAAIWVTMLAVVLSFFSYERHPHIPDEVVYLYHARYLADGRLTVPAPPVPEAFSFYLIPYQADRWYSIFSPGWPAMLAVGVLMGVPWLVNPILAGLNVLLVYLLLQEIYDRRLTRMVVLLLCVSPWYVFMGMNFMAHTFTLTCTLTAAIGIAWVHKTNKARWALLAGGAVGVISLIRPLDALIVAIFLGLWIIGVGIRRLTISAISAFGFGTILVAAIVLPYNTQITGSPTTLPLMNYYEEYFGPKTNALGFGPERGLGWSLDAFPGHSPLEAVINGSLNSFSINIELFGWSIGSLFIVTITIVFFFKVLTKNDFFLLVIIATVPAVYSFYWFSGGPDFGARYWYLILVPLVGLTARGIQLLVDKFDSNDNFGSHLAGTRVIATLLIMCLFALVNYFPWRAIDKYHHFRGMRPDIVDLADAHNFGKSLVLIQGNTSDYRSAWIYNPLDFNDDSPLYAWNQNTEIRLKVLEEYSDRPVWLVDGPSVTQASYEVIDGPLPAQILIEQTHNQ